MVFLFHGSHLLIIVIFQTKPRHECLHPLLFFLPVNEGESIQHFIDLCQWFFHFVGSPTRWPWAKQTPVEFSIDQEYFSFILLLFFSTFFLGLFFYSSSLGLNLIFSRNVENSWTIEVEERNEEGFPKERQISVFPNSTCSLIDIFFGK